AVCTGMAAMALGSDGGGSIRYPAGLTGLVGLKPQGDRLPVGDEHASGWHGLLTLGPLTRSARDAALFLEVTSNSMSPAPIDDPLHEPSRPLTIAVATNPPPGANVSLAPDGAAIIANCCELLRELGHTVIDATVNYSRASLWNTTVRFLKGVQHDVTSMPHHQQLERRTRNVARLGRLLPQRSLTGAIEHEQQLSAGLNAVFEHADILLTPLCESPAPPLSTCPQRGAIRSLRQANTSAWLIPWNLTGQPAISIPTGLHKARPTAIQLVAPHNDETTLLALATQIEHRRPFPRLPHDSSQS
ncbi:MAG: amidase family protein, partial [Actinomycetota bacterium]